MPERSHPSWLSSASRTTLIVAFAAVVLALVSFLLGPSHLGPGALFKGLISSHGAAAVIAREIRLPRALLALLVGAALGSSGAALQGLFRNPLAEPGVTGVTSSAGLGAILALYFGFAAMSPLLLPSFAIAGALISAGILYALSRAGAGITALILAGVAIASFATALTALALSLASNPFAMSEMVHWLLGSLKDVTLRDAAFAVAPIAAGIALIQTTGRGLDALVLGEEAAQSLGIDLHAVRRRAIVGVALATGAATAVAGAVSFVGLVVPHLLRRAYGYEPSRILWPSALGGAALVTAADIAIRLISPGEELNLGVLTALLGAPFFVALILRVRSES